MPSEPGSPEPLREVVAAHLDEMQAADEVNKLGPMPQSLTTEEQEHIADGEPYCFRCGKPASSFGEYRTAVSEGVEFADEAELRIHVVAYVLRDEGTYNPATNRFACDECYIAIGMPAGEPGDAYGWKAP